MSRNKFTEVVFHELPTDYNVFLNIVESTLNLPERAAALFILALRIYAVDNELGIQMLSYLRHLDSLEEQEIKKLLEEPLRKSRYIPLAYFKGASPQNCYTPDEPYVITIKEDSKKSLKRKYKTLYIGCPGAGIYRPITLVKIKKRKVKNKRFLGNPWFVEEYASLTLPVPEPVQKELHEKQKD